MDILGKTQVFTRGSRQDLVVSRGTIVFTTGVGGMSLLSRGSGGSWCGVLHGNGRLPLSMSSEKTSLAWGKRGFCIKTAFDSFQGSLFLSTCRKSAVLGALW